MVVLGGCGATGTEAAGVPSGRSSLAVTASAVCPEGYGPLELQPETLEEAELVALTTACGDVLGRSVYLQNRSKSVWVIDSPAGLVRSGSSQAGPQVELYRHFATGRVSGLTLEPDTNVYVPLSRGQQLHMRLDGPAQAMWQVGETLKERVVTGGRDALIKATTRGSMTNRAFATCFAQGYDFGAGLSEITADGAALTEYLGLGRSIGDCGQAIRTAQQDAVQTRTPTLVTLEGATQVARSRPFLAGSTSSLRTVLSRLSAVVPR
ncbi:hypothetical protein [Actinomycetospora flava]|uniref:Lipoprotein n=1 Tax=Actinomycetospora flava TaxID=3129232 RepID=A0ABU8M5N5_9PSEU